jgi:iron(III) transport system permease protein
LEQENLVAETMQEAPGNASGFLSGMAGRARRFQWRSLLRTQTIVIAVGIVLVAWLALVPLCYLLWQTFYDGQSITLANFREAYGATGLGQMAWNSLLFTVGATLFSVVGGTTLAYLVVRTDVPFKPLVYGASLIPLIIPGILYTISWIFLLSPRTGLYNQWLEPIFGPGFFNVFSVAGMILVDGLHTTPLAFLFMYAAFRSMDPSLEESALMSGARMPAMIRRITLPLTKPALYAAILVMAVRAMESFEVPALLGLPSNIYVFTSRIWYSLDQYPPRFGQAGAYAVLLLVITTVGLVLQSRLSNSGKTYQTISGKGFRPHPMELGKLRWVAAFMILLYFIVAVVVPMLILIYASTQSYYSSPTWSSITHGTLSNYTDVLQDNIVKRATINSLMLGIGTATAVMFVMAIISWIVVRTKVPGRVLLDTLSFLPLSIPGLVMGVALLFVYLRFPVPVYGTIVILFIAYFTRYMPYGMRYASTSMYQISVELEEAAATSGASWWQTFRRIYLPLLMPGLIAGWTYIVMVSFRELSSSILLYSPGNEVLSVLIFLLWNNGQFGELSALGVMMIAILVVIVLVARKLGARVGVRQ